MNPVSLSRPVQLTDTQGEAVAGLRRFRPRLVLGYQQQLFTLGAAITECDEAEVESRLAAAVEAADAAWISSVRRGYPLRI